MSLQINNTYDANGNLKLISHDNLDTGISTTRGLYWDEQNRLQAIVEDNTAYHYVYDASGERILKSSGSSADLVINGDQVTTLNNPGTYTMYPSGYLVVGTHDYTKHYYSGSQRIASRIGDLSAVNNFESDSLSKQSPAKGKISLAAKKIALQKQLATIYKKANLGKPNFALAPQAPVDPAEQQCQNEYDALLQYWTSLIQPPPADNTVY
ncbi:hypothetical protein OX284_012180 [Flavobacterium sp. SUN046]|uniref:hypothetical protein n=1 Tax=Flavobacterium sp. SUN046 TaxID=3002440 RepID=UPI002DBB4B45|nr:hypothetical protein [Flavobacterium sp. SUN046]MEC4050191.1 hypothetical protein [Flavobacterium sp. SUN046]